jgi:hypothetical protein
MGQPPGPTGPLAIDTTTGEGRAGTRVVALPHDILTIEPLDEGSTGGDYDHHRQPAPGHAHAA